MNISALINALPVFERKRDVIIFGTQTVREIEKEVLDAHERYASHYDNLVGFFKGNTPRRLFEFCQKYLPYREEPDDDQTTKSPSALIQSRSNDCKHYAGFIAGVLDAMNRTGDYEYDWVYRFVNYKPGKRMADHVFVVVDGDLWIDPTPIKEKQTGAYIIRSYNDRLMIPVNYHDFKPDNMLSSIHGVHYIVDQSTDTAPSTCNLGCSGVGFSLADLLGGGSGGGSSTLSTVTNAAIQTAGGPFIQAAQSVASQLPDGGFKDWVNNFLSDPTNAIRTLIFGRKFTTGDYRAGEYYMRNILGMNQIQRQGQVPDSYVPQAWSFWTLAMGVPVRPWDDMDALVAGNYKSRVNGGYDFVTDAQVNRAMDILHNHVGWTQNYQPRDQTWPVVKFGEIPYIYPMYDVYDSNIGIKYYSGIHPVTGQEFLNGYPKQVATPANPAPPPTGVPTDTTGTGGGAPPVNKAGFGLLPMLILGGLAFGVIASQNKKHA